MDNNLEFLSDIALKALFAKWFKSQVKKLRCYEIQKTFMVTAFIGHWSGNCSHYVWGICSTPTCEACVKLEKNCAVCFGSFLRTSGWGVNWPLWVFAYNCKNLHEFFSSFFVTYLRCVITKINKSQKISTCCVKYVLFILEKTKQKGSIDPYGPSRVNIPSTSHVAKEGGGGARAPPIGLKSM